MSDQQDGRRFRKVGAMWKAQTGSKAKASGSVTVNGMRQRFVVLPNDRKAEGSKEPDYVLMSSDEPEPDTYQQQGQGRPGPARRP